MSEGKKDHEIAIAKHLIKEACEQAKGRPVLEVSIAAAKCAGLDERLMRFYWDQYAADTPCHGARIHYRIVPFIQKCPRCGHIFAAKSQQAPCPQCHNPHTATLVGDGCALVESLTTAE